MNYTNTHGPMIAEKLAALLAGVQPWDDEKRQQLHSTAINVTRHSTHAGNSHEARKLAMDNCGRCALDGRGADSDGSPNYAGWLRVYIQLGWPVKLALFEQQMARTDNDAYLHAVRRDIATWGIQFA